ncbi:MAG: adenosylcobinamide-GDP ribazoletransferase [Lachnospiraceae bacterium]|nr:adenosylcobinamide-GDP ribazoletransferase [Lachnospiraceae bacterium]
MHGGTDRWNMKILRWMAVSFSLYSRIPVPRFKWTEEDMAHSLIFFPWVGAVIGLLFYGAVKLAELMGADAVVQAVVLLLIPVLVTGGFHLDGFMDTRDALSSYAPREKKLEILKDPHTGAFAVTGMISSFLVMFLAMYLTVSQGGKACVLGAVFVISRSLSALTSVCTEKARKDGMLKEETKGSRGGIVFASLLWMIPAAGLMIYADMLHAPFIAAVFAVYTPLYRRKMLREFGGVSGDTAGYFVTRSEMWACLAYGLSLLILKQ